MATNEEAENDPRNGLALPGTSRDERADRTRSDVTDRFTRVEDLALPDEDPKALADRMAAWTEFYDPRGPGEEVLVYRLVMATIQLDRCARFSDAMIAEQVREALRRFDEQRDMAREESRRKAETDALRPIMPRSDLESSSGARKVDRAGSRDTSNGDGGVPGPRSVNRIGGYLPDVAPEGFQSGLDAERAMVADLALMIEDPESAKADLRDYNSAISSFFRAVNALEKIKKARARAAASNVPGRRTARPGR